MNELQRIDSSTTNEIASLLIPLVDRQLIIPTVTVAEMVPFQPPKRDPEAPDWYLGDVIWREQAIPIVSYEVMCGEAMPSYTSTCRLAILNNTGVSPELPFLGLATQGIPRLSRVKADEISEQEGADLKRFDLMAVYHAGESVVIPDVSAIETAFLDYKKHQ